MTNKMKIIKIAGVVLLSILLIAAIYFIFIKDSNEPSLEERVDSRILAYETDLLDSLPTLNSDEAVVKYLVNWGENKGIKVKTDKYDNVFFSVPASKGVESEKSTVIFCGYDSKCMESYINSLACAMTIAKNDTEHGAFKVIFVSENPDKTSNIEKISKKNIPDDADVFYLGNTSVSKIGTATGGYNEYTISKTYKEVKPTHNKAYKITISGLPTEKIDSSSIKVINPIKRLGNLLATFKSNSIIFELASFEGGAEADITPGSASMTIVVNNDATDKLEKSLNDAIEKFNDSYSKKYPEASFTFEVCSMPTKVLSSSDTEYVVSLMYTMINGVYSTDEDDDDYVTSFANIGHISIKNKKIVINAGASSYDINKLLEIRDSYKTICALSNMDFKVFSSKEVFKVNDAGNALAKRFTISYKKYKTTELKKSDVPEYAPCSYISNINDTAGVIYLGVTEKTKDNFAGGIIVHMQP